MSRLPTPGGDNNNWGTILNNFLSVSLNSDGTLNSSQLATAGASVFTTIPVISTRSSSYSPSVSSSEIVLANASSNAVGITLPTAASNTNLYTVKKIDSSTNYVVVSTTNSQTIDGGTSAMLKVQYAAITFVSDGSNWNII